jgi:Phospholipase_D-nuclease N-terminal
MERLTGILYFVIPLALLQLALMIVALVDLIRRKRTKGPKWVWVLAIVFVNFFGPIVYLLFGREEEDAGDSD